MLSLKNAIISEFQKSGLLSSQRKLHYGSQKYQIVLIVCVRGVRVVEKQAAKPLFFNTLRTYLHNSAEFYRHKPVSAIQGDVMVEYRHFSFLLGVVLINRSLRVLMDVISRHIAPVQYKSPQE